DRIDPLHARPARAKARPAAVTSPRCNLHGVRARAQTACTWVLNERAAPARRRGREGGYRSVVLVVELPGLVVARRRAVGRLPARGGVVVVLDLHHDRLGRGKRRQIDRRARALRDDAGLPIRSFAQAERHPRGPPAAAGQVVAAAIRELRARPFPTRAPAAVLPRGGAGASDGMAGAVEDAELVARRGSGSPKSAFEVAAPNTHF